MVEILTFGVAALPFVVAGACLIGLRWSAPRASFAALIAAVGGAILWPGLDGGVISGAFVSGLGTSWRVLFVLFGGLLLYNLMNSGGAIDAVSGFLGRVEPDSSLLALGVVIGVAPFFESVTGFGVAVVISAPILVAAGFSPLKAAVLSTWGQCAVPWGALGIGTVIGADLSGLSFAELSNWSAALSLPLFPVYGLCSLALTGGIEALRKYWIEALGLGFTAGAGTFVTSLLLAPELSGAVGGLAATGVFITLRRGRLSRLTVPFRAVAPYAVLVTAVVAFGAIPDLLTLSDFAYLLLEGPGIPLLLACVFASVTFGLGAGGVSDALPATIRQWLPTALSVVGFVMAGQVVAGSGAAEVLAGAAGSTGGFFPVAAALLGGAGGALAGSNAASNALFMPLQVEAARSVGDSTSLIAAVQNVAGSHSSMLAPQRIVLSAAAVGMAGREGEIVLKALPPVVISLAIVGAISLLIA